MPTDHEPLLFYFPESKNISKSSESEADYLFSTVYSKAIKIAAGLKKGQILFLHKMDISAYHFYVRQNIKFSVFI